MLWLLTAVSLLSAPERVKDRSWWSPQDVPTQMLQDDITYWVGYALIVGPKGKVRGCRIEKSSGLPKLDNYTCGVASGRARLLPATNADGKATYGVYREFTSYWMGNSPSTYKRRERYGDLDVSVAAALLPKGKIEHVNVALAVDERGIPISCKETKRESNVKLVELVCPAAIANLRLTPVSNKQGKYVPSVQMVTVSISPR